MNSVLLEKCFVLLKIFLKIYFYFAWQKLDQRNVELKNIKNWQHPYFCMQGAFDVCLTFVGVR